MSIATASPKSFQNPYVLLQNMDLRPVTSIKPMQIKVNTKEYSKNPQLSSASADFRVIRILLGGGLGRDRLLRTCVEVKCWDYLWMLFIEFGGWDYLLSSSVKIINWNQLSRLSAEISCWDYLLRSAVETICWDQLLRLSVEIIAGVHLLRLSIELSSWNDLLR